ncbi:MAG: c-type cytochrome [Acidobacteriota bacterium]
MRCHALILAGTVATLAIVGVHAQTQRITLPPDTSRLRPSSLRGSAIAQQKCGICHSADYVSFQPPAMTQAQWTAEMTKMRQAYGAPLDDQDIKSLGAYLAVAYGSASATDTSVIEASGQPPGTGAPPTGLGIDVQALLNANGCFGCHAVDKTLVGPSFAEIALKYQGNKDATAVLARSIRQGVVGKWGQVPMPAITALDEPQASALAEFVLSRKGTGMRAAVGR